MSERLIAASLFQRTLAAGIGRLACAYLDPSADGHDHAAECLTDDESYAADLVLRVVAAAAAGDEDSALSRLVELLAALDPAR